MRSCYLLCTDLDRTVIPNGPQVESRAAAAAFAALAARPEITLAYVSGRHRELVESAIAEYGLPTPDFVIGDVGTTLYRLGHDAGWQAADTWDSRFAEDWKGFEAADLLHWLCGVPELVPQEAEKQNRFKASYYVDAAANTGRLQAEIESVLAPRGVAARQVWSHDVLTGSGLLDLLPARASKRSAIEALLASERFNFSRTVFCGDSGNDLHVLISPIRAVLVANASEDVRDEAVRLAGQAGQRDRLYLARGGFRGMNGCYRGGVVEGVAHYYPEIEAWLPGGAAA